MDEASDWESSICVSTRWGPAHTSNRAQTYLKKKTNFWFKNCWHPSSPDLNPLDFSIWGQIEAKACKNRPANIESLKKLISEA